MLPRSGGEPLEAHADSEGASLSSLLLTLHIVVVIRTQP
jgi:hypothetical protein